MYSTNIILKTIITLILIVVTFFMSNYYLFWLLVFYLLLLTIVDKNLVSLVILFMITLILLFVWFSVKIRMLTQGLVIVDILVLYITSITKRDLWKIKYEEGYKSIYRRKKIFMNNFKPYLRKNEMARLDKYDYNADEKVINNKINQDADDLYAYSKIRFYGYGSTVTSMYGKWSIYDLIFFLVSAFVFVLLFKFWG